MFKCFVAPIPDVLPQSIKVMGGWISPLKEAPVSVAIVDDSGSDFEIKAGDQIAWMHTLCAIEPELVDVTTDWLINQRGTINALCNAI